MRFSITDPIVKGICRCTDVVVAVSVSDLGTKAGPSASSMLTPSHQKTFSKDVIPDYRLYTLKYQYKSQYSQHQQFPVIGIAEVKGMEDFNDRAVCQTIGYHIASLYDKFLCLIFKQQVKPTLPRDRQLHGARCYGYVSNRIHQPNLIQLEFQFH